MQHAAARGEERCELNLNFGSLRLAEASRHRDGAALTALSK